MDWSERPSSERMEDAKPMDVEFLPIVLTHKIHRNLKSSQVEIVTQPYYQREVTPEPEPEVDGEAEPEPVPPTVVYAAPLPALRERKNWWDFYKPVYSFNNPRIRARVELLMTSRIVYVMDRRYMVRLQEKIKEDHDLCLKLRIKAREADEMEREKVLLLKGKIPYEKAPAELRKHPVCRINQIAQRIIRRKRAKSKKTDKTSAYRTSRRRIRIAEKALGGNIYEKDSDRGLDSALLATSVCIVDAEPAEDVDKGLMFSPEDYDKLKFEDPLMKMLRGVDGVNDMYNLADKIIGLTKVVISSGKSKFRIEQTEV